MTIVYEGLQKPLGTKDDPNIGPDTHRWCLADNATVGSCLQTNSLKYACNLSQRSVVYQSPFNDFTPAFTFSFFETPFCSALLLLSIIFSSFSALLSPSPM